MVQPNRTLLYQINSITLLAPLYQTLSARLATTAPSLRRNWRERRQPPAAVPALNQRHHATHRSILAKQLGFTFINRHSLRQTTEQRHYQIHVGEKAQLLHCLGTGNPLAAMAHSTL
jgi:hypothetical protein